MGNNSNSHEWLFSFVSHAFFFICRYSCSLLTYMHIGMCYGAIF
nr:MAG TPA: hypothetical protein [Caudoviricetes sp.]